MSTTTVRILCGETWKMLELTDQSEPIDVLRAMIRPHRLDTDNIFLAAKWVVARIDSARAIEWDSSPCSGQPNAARLPDGGVIFDACGECEACLATGSKGPTYTRLDPSETRPATSAEDAARAAAYEAICH